MSLMEREMKKISRILSPDYTGPVESSEEEEDGSDAREAALKTALHILKDMKAQDLVEKLTKCKTDTLKIKRRYKVNHRLLVQR